MTLTVGLAAITGTYNGTVVLSDKMPPHVVSAGRGRPGTARIREGQLRRSRFGADGATTVVDVSGAVQTGGPIARVGQRLIGGVAKMMMDRFFACLKAKLRGGR